MIDRGKPTYGKKIWNSHLLVYGLLYEINADEQMEPVMPNLLGLLFYDCKLFSFQ